MVWETKFGTVKSCGQKAVRVQVPLRVLLKIFLLKDLTFFLESFIFEQRNGEFCICFCPSFAKRFVKTVKKGRTRVECRPEGRSYMAM